MTDLRHLLAIYVHARQTGNSVPPHIDADARAALAAEPVYVASEPSDEDLADLAEVFNGDPLPAIRRALELWGRPTIAALAAEPPAPADPLLGFAATLAASQRPMDPEVAAALTPEARWGLYDGAPAPAVGSEREELAALIEQTADSHNGLWPGLIIGKLYRAAALLRQLPPEGLLAVEYVHIDSGARIICEPNEECSGGHWAVLNSRHVNPCIEFRTVADAVAALQQARQQEVGDD